MPHERATIFTTAPSVEYLRNMTMHPDPRPAILADLQTIEEIVRHAYSPYICRIGRQPGPMSDDYEVLISKGRVYVVELDGTIQGILVLVPEQDAMLPANVAAAPSAKGTGIGRSLLEYAEHPARAAGYRLPPPVSNPSSACRWEPTSPRQSFDLRAFPAGQSLPRSRV